jgi:transposase-like protein
MELFPNNDACLDYLKAKFYADGTACPGCGKATKFHRIKSRAAYSCQYCRHQVYPTADTIFHKSSTSLQLWFWAIFLMSSTRCGISAKQLEREIGVSYPTAHRMFKQIRTLLSDDQSDLLTGEVEMDESFFGGVRKRGKGRKPGPKTAVFGMVERGGRVIAVTVENTSAMNLGVEYRKHVLPASTVFTDDYKSYNDVTRSGYTHNRINHSAGIYVAGDVHTQTIEGFWSLVKNGIRGTYHAVSTEYLQAYLDEYSFRFNRRDGQQPIFWAILDRVGKQRPLGIA